MQEGRDFVAKVFSDEFLSPFCGKKDEPCHGLSDGKDELRENNQPWQSAVEDNSIIESNSNNRDCFLRSNDEIIYKDYCTRSVAATGL